MFTGLNQDCALTSSTRLWLFCAYDTLCPSLNAGCLTLECNLLLYATLSIRLLQVLDHDSGHGRSEPFRTYEALDQAARDLAGNLQVTRDALAGAGREQYYTAARLYADCEALHRAMSTELQQLVLGPQVRPTAITDQELLCPNAQVGLFPFISCMVILVNHTECISEAILNVSQLI